MQKRIMMTSPAMGSTHGLGGSPNDSIRVDVEHFKRNGYVIVKQVFSKTEIADLRQRFTAIKGSALQSKNYLRDISKPKLVLILGDLLSNKELEDLDYIIFDKRIIACVKQLAGQRITYFGDSSVQTGEGARGFHKDNVDRYDINGADWQGDYPLVRVALYLQDHSRHSGGVKLRVRSHCYASYHRGKAIDVKTELGDIVMWNLRTTHSGNNVRLKIFPNVCLHPRLEAITPQWLKLPEESERIAIFGTFGAPGSHLDRYIENMVRRGDYDEYLRRAGLNKRILELARQRGVEIRKPIPEYGSLSAYYEEC